MLILGGNIASPEPECFLRNLLVDFVVIGEGEITMVKLLNVLEKKVRL